MDQTTDPITTYQPTYFVADSFTDAKERMIQYGKSMKKSFEIQYNPYSQQLQTTPLTSKSRYDSINVMSEVEKKFSSVDTP
jgi:phenylalanine-4-hydroxylase